MQTINPFTSIKVQKYKKAFTLIELVIVIAIIGVLVTITIPYFSRYIEKARTEICNINCLQSQKHYNIYLEIEEIQHSEEIFTKFLEDYNELCPKDGEISYRNGNFNCKIHSKDEENDDVPYI